ncbi:MAG: sugar phosphate isomerase/epimerase [Clostridia bacterium]|nr:sugar phosphate isomerase/epimerase [Clostridia bacterium]
MLFSTQLEVIAFEVGKERGIELLAEAGFPAIDITIFGNIDYVLADDWRETAKRYRETADRCGVIFNQAHAPICAGYDKYVNELVPLMPRVFEFASILGVRQIVVHPLTRGIHDGHEEELFEMNMEFYKSLAPHAKRLGMKICLENMWSKNPLTGSVCDDVCADPRELIRYYEALNDPEVFTICLDLGHVAICGREPQDVIRAIGRDRLGALHVHDVDYIHDMHTIPGVGRINWDAVCRALADIDYQGEFTLEADQFMIKYEPALRPAASKFMAEICKHMVAKIEKYKA